MKIINTYEETIDGEVFVVEEFDNGVKVQTLKASIVDPNTIEEPEPQPTQLDTIEANTTYLVMMMEEV